MGKKADLARLRGFNHDALAKQEYGLQKKPLMATTNYSYAYNRRIFEEFLVDVKHYSEAECIATFKQGTPLPDQNTIKAFLEWFCVAATGRLSQRPTLNTLETTFYRLRTNLRRSTGHEFPKARSDDVLGCIRDRLLTQYNIPHIAKEKGYTDEVDLEALIEQIWCFDAKEILHERTRIQLALLTLLHFYSGARPGSLLPTDHYPENYLKYQDFKLHLVNDKGQQRFYLTLRQNQMKGRKKTCEYLETALTESTRFGECPIILFLALAFADNAFLDASAPEELLELSCNTSSDRREILYKAEKKAEAVFKSEKGGLKNHFSYAAFFNHLKALSERAGYSAHVQPYSIRRAVANRLNENVTTAQRNQILGHYNDQVYGKAYQMALSSVNIQGLMLKNADEASWDIAKLRRTTRDGPHHVSLPLRMLQEIDIKLEELCLEKSSNQYQKTRRNLLNHAWRGNIQALRESSDVDLTHKRAGSAKVTGIPESVERLGDLSLHRTLASIVMRYDSNRASIAEAFRKTSYLLRNSSAPLRTLIRMAQLQSHGDFYYPKEWPLEVINDGQLSLLCAFCRKYMLPIEKRSRAAHTHSCARKASQRSMCKKTSPHPPHYCYRCNLWFSVDSEYQEHCQVHYFELDQFCGIIRLRQVVVVPGRCPYCLGDGRITDWNVRMGNFLNGSKFKDHLQGHLSEIAEDSTPICPHPACAEAQTSISELLHHLHDHHGISEAKDLVSRKRKRTHDDWGQDESCTDSILPGGFVNLSRTKEEQTALLVTANTTNL